METERRVKVYEINYRCEECGIGCLERSGPMLLSNPPQYTHVCNNCGDTKTFKNKYYPHIKYVEYYY